MHPGEKAFTPLLKRIEVILEEGPDNNEALDLLAFFGNQDAQLARGEIES